MWQQSKEASASHDNNTDVLSNQNPPTTSISPLTTPLYPPLPTSETLQSSLTTAFPLKPTSMTSPEQLSFILKILSVSTHHSVTPLSELLSMLLLHYCNSIFCASSSKVLKKLQHIQNSAACLLTHTCFCSHITQSFRNSIGSQSPNVITLRSSSRPIQAFPSTRPPSTSLSCSTTTLLPAVSVSLMPTSSLHHLESSTGPKATEPSR